RGREFLYAVMRRHILRLEVNLRDAAIVAGDQPVENFREPDSRAPVDPAHDSEIDRSDPPVGEGEQIPVVKVGVEETVTTAWRRNARTNVMASAWQSCPASISASR